MNGLGAGCVQLWIRSAEPAGEHRNENRNINNTCQKMRKDAKIAEKMRKGPSFMRKQALLCIDKVISIWY